MSAELEKEATPARWLARAAWLGFVPLVLSLAAFQFLIPTQAGDGLPKVLMKLGGRHGLYLVLGFFLVFSVLIRYWRPYLPGGAHLGRASSAPLGPGGLLELRRISGFALWVGAGVVLAFALRAFVRPYEVTSSSMLPTLRRGDELLVNQAAYGFPTPFGARATPTQPPRRGDVIVFKKEIDGKVEELVKRVIGLPGDKITTEGALLVVNGKAPDVCQAGRYVYMGADTIVDGRVFVEFLDGAAFLTVYTPVHASTFSEYVVKPGEVFVVGDDRDNSSDSRAWSKDPGVPFSSIVGRVDRLLVGARNAGSVDVSTVFRKLGFDAKLPGVDSTELEAGIENCLGQRAPAAARPSQAP